MSSCHHRCIAHSTLFFRAKLVRKQDHYTPKRLKSPFSNAISASVSLVTPSSDINLVPCLHKYLINALIPQTDRYSRASQPRQTYSEPINGILPWIFNVLLAIESKRVSDERKPLSGMKSPLRRLSLNSQKKITKNTPWTVTPIASSTVRLFLLLFLGSTFGNIGSKLT